MSRTQGPISKKPLRGASVQYEDGRIVTPEPLDVEQVLADFERLGERDRMAFLSVLAHDLTVEMRALLFDRPVSQTKLDRACQINEALHQLTSCVNPRHRWSTADEAELVRAIIDSSYVYGLERAVGRALATAVESVMAGARESAIAIE
ncbi:MAG TPA: hypothetical protein VG651_12960 [Stellaceae bacterium]|nr:hypothetical protein [Stellaceae bacterium]